MKRLLRPLALALAMMLLLSGCSMEPVRQWFRNLNLSAIEIPWPELNLFDREYYSEEVYQPQTEEADDAADGTSGISNYTELVRAITDMVEAHEEAAVLQLPNYEGTVSADLSEACWAVKASTALGAFAVDYISYDVSRIVSYYQAEINITYKRSAYQIDAMEELPGITALSDRITSALEEEESYLVLRINSAAATADAVTQAVSDAYYGDPLVCPVLPEVTVEVFPESGMDRILEITVSYGADSETLAEKRSQLQSGLVSLLAAAGLADEDETASQELAALSIDFADDAACADALYALCTALSERCVCEETAGATAWDALTQGTASSEGVSMALEAVCQTLGIPCRVIRGYRDSGEQVWDLVTVGDETYHVDVSAWGEDGQGVFLAGDDEISSTHWWDASQYPVCGHDYYYFGLPEGSGELSQEEEP